MTIDDKLEEIVITINSFATHVEERFNGVDGRLTALEDRVKKIENNMVTKYYLDDKLADLKGDLVLAIKKVDEKVVTLTGILNHKQFVSNTEAQSVLAIQPFVRERGTGNSLALF